MMAGHLTPLAKNVRTAAEASAALDEAARALLEAAGPSDDYRVVDAGAKLFVVLIPGFGPLSMPADHVKMAAQIS